MKFITTLILLLVFSTSFSQWTRVVQLPASNVFSLYHKDSVLYAGASNRVYTSRDKGQTWDSSAIIPQSVFIDNIIVYKNELYITSISIGVFKSLDDGVSWQNITSGMPPFATGLCEFKGDLYAANDGAAGSVFKLNASRNNWLPFSQGLSNLSVNTTAIAGTSKTIVAGTAGNGLYDYLAPNETTWEERFLLGQIRPSEATYTIITAHDSLFLAGSTGRFYMSTDNGLNWTIFGNTVPSLFSSLVNAKQALLSSVVSLNGTFNTTFFYIKKDSLDHPFVPFSLVGDHITHKLDILGGKIWDASTKGLFFMSLSDLPGISEENDSLPPLPLPVRFISFTARCGENNVLINWKTAQEQNSSHFDIEKSLDGLNWTVIGRAPAAGDSFTETSYSFTDNSAVQNSYYRIAEYDRDEKVQYTNTLRSTCAVPATFRSWPNPVHDMAFINIVAPTQSQVITKLFDAKGSLVKEQKETVLQGSNQLSIDMRSLANGVYSLSVEWGNGQLKKMVRILKQ